MLKIQDSIHNIFATTVDTKDQKTEPDSQCPTEHTKTNPTATPFLVVEIFSFKKSHPIHKIPSVSLKYRVISEERWKEKRGSRV